MPAASGSALPSTMYGSSCVSSPMPWPVRCRKAGPYPAPAIGVRAAASTDSARTPGATAATAARDVIAAGGYGEYFIHRTGHGIGLDTHEAPYIVEGNDLPLVPGMAFSVEPGIYLPGRWGARIEDIVVCTDDGVRSLNGVTRELVELPG